MPADRKSASRRTPKPAAPAADAPPAESEPAEADEAAVPLNRAERRGQAKRGSKSDVAGRGKVAGRSGPVQGPRMWSNRRGGG